MFLIDFLLLCPFKRVLREIYTPPEAVTTFSSLPAGWQDVGSRGVEGRRDKGGGKRVEGKERNYGNYY